MVYYRKTNSPTLLGQYDEPYPPRRVVSRYLVALTDFYATYPDANAEDDALLAFLSEKHADGQNVCSTDLVKSRRFGTLPTVTTRLTKLASLGFIETEVGDDRRVKWLKPTKEGEKVLEQRAKLLMDAGLN